MISDAEFWLEIRRKQAGGDAIFRAMLAALHARQLRLDPHTTLLEREEATLTTIGKERRDQNDGKLCTADEKKAADEAKKTREKQFREMEKPLEANKSLQLALADPLPTTATTARVATITVRVLQQVMMYAVPIYSLRYNVPAMSMSWNTSCFIDRPYKQLITFGAGQGVKVPQLLQGRGCVAGDGFFAILSDHDEVWASGGLKVSSSSVNGPTPLGREEAMTGIAAKTLMLVGHGQRLASVTRAFTVRSLSALSNPTRSIIPSRHIRFLDLGYGEDYYMVGTDSIVYKTTASKRAISTPRRVMTLSRMPVSRVASGTSFLLIIDQNGHLYSLGRNRKGQLGNGEKQDARRKPHFQDGLTEHFFTQVAAGDCHSLALTSSGVVYGAGSNESGQLGLGSSVKEVLVFTPIPLPAKCVGVAAGPAGSMFTCVDGSVLTCGLNDCMQLGVESSQKFIYEPTAVLALSEGVESYTMDFGGYRRPDPDDDDDGDGAKTMHSTSNDPSPLAASDGKLSRHTDLQASTNVVSAHEGSLDASRRAAGDSSVNNQSRDQSQTKKGTADASAARLGASESERATAGAGAAADDDGDASINRQTSAGMLGTATQVHVDGPKPEDHEPASGLDASGKTATAGGLGASRQSGRSQNAAKSAAKADSTAKPSTKAKDAEKDKKAKGGCKCSCAVM